jgi:hypothetical protein
MALVIEFFDATTGLNLYALLFDEAGKAFNPSAEAFQTYLDANITNFNLNLTEGVNRKKYYSYTISPTLSAGAYTVEVYRRVGASPSKTNDIFKGIGTIFWNGSGMVDNIDPPHLEEGSEIGTITLDSTVGFYINAYDKFGNLANPEGNLDFAVYRQNTSLGVTGYMSNLETGVFYSSFAANSGTFNFNDIYSIQIKGYIKGTRVGANLQFRTSVLGSGVQAIDAAHQLGYSSGFILEANSASGYVTTLPGTVDDFYNGQVVRVLGTGSLRGQARIIRDYTGATRFVQTNMPFTSALPSGTPILIFPIGGELGL